MGWKNESEYKWFMSHDQDGRHAHICPQKTLQNLLLWNRMADELEMWYAALSTHILPRLFKWCIWVDTDLFYGKVKFAPLCFCLGKIKTIDFSEIIVVYHIKFVDAVN